MALFDEENWKFLLGFAAGIGAALLAKEASPAFKGVGRPLAKAGAKSALLLAERTRESIELWSERSEDLFAEARAELEAETRLGAEPETPAEPSPKGGVT
jgi:hypothetical protein